MDILRCLTAGTTLLLVHPSGGGCGGGFNKFGGIGRRESPTTASIRLISLVLVLKKDWSQYNTTSLIVRIAWLNNSKSKPCIGVTKGH